MKGKELSKQAQENLTKIETLRKEQDTIRNESQKEIYHVQWDVYQPKMRTLEEERDRVIREIEEKYKQAQLVKEAEFEKLYIPIDQVKRILMFLRLDTTRDLTIKDDDVKPYSSYRKPTIESLGYIFDDDYLKIKMFIIENRKPKNKYSLVALGHCLFHDGLLKLPKTYGVDAVTPWSCYPEVVVRDFPSVSELRGWFESRQKKVLADAVGEYPEVKTEYLEVIKNYKLEDFADLDL